MNNRRLQGWNAQKTAFTYAKDRTFEPGLRSGGLYQDLGLAEATGGQFHGEIIKVNPEFVEAEKITAQNTAGTQPHDTTGMHRHEYDLQFNYMLAGDIDFVIAGINDAPGDEKMVFGPEDTYLIESRVLHNETRVSDDFSVLQVYGPAKSETETVGQAVGIGEVSEDWAEKLSKMTRQTLQGWNKQMSTFNYVKDREFGPGLRGDHLYADLGVAEGTGGNFHAHIIKINPEKITAQHTTGMHRHGYDFQFNYVISGEVDFVIEGFDETMTFRAGDTYFLPSKTLHNETRMTEDFQVLQLYAPANDPTEQLTPEVP